MGCAGVSNHAGLIQALTVARAVFPKIPISTPVGTKDLPAVMAAIAGQESAYEAGITNGPYVGLWQIGSNQTALRTHLRVPAAQWVAWLKTPAHNAQAAWLLMQLRGGSWPNRLAAWSTYTSGAYIECLASVEAAVATVRRMPDHPPHRRTIATAAFVGYGALSTAALFAVLLA